MRETLPEPYDTLLEVSIRSGYKKSVILDGLEFSIRPGEVLGLVGASGAGKSTVLLAILGLLRDRNGWVEGSILLRQQQLLGLRQRELRSLRGRVIALVPQSPVGALSPVLRLQTHFREAWLGHTPPDRAAMQRRIKDVLESVHLPTDDSFLRRRASEVSVGQAQRVLIALALLHRPQLIIADEPTSALDPVSRMEILDLLAELTGPGKAGLLYVSHDMLSVLKLCSRVAVLDGGRIVETVAAEQIAHCRSAAARRLLGALPVPAELLLRREEALFAG